MKTFSTHHNLDVYFHWRNHYRRIRNAHSTLGCHQKAGPYLQRQIPSVLTSRNCHHCYTKPTTSPVQIQEFMVNTLGHTSNQSTNTQNAIAGRCKCGPSNSCYNRGNTTKRTRLSPVTTPSNNRCNAVNKLAHLPTHSKGIKRHDCLHERINKMDHLNKARPSRSLQVEELHPVVKSNINKINGDVSIKHTSRPVVKDHEYINFLLRIIEDILVHNLYTDKDLEKIFQNHISANRCRLDTNTMLSLVNDIKREIKFPRNNQADKTTNFPNYVSVITREGNLQHIQQPDHHIVCSAVAASYSNALKTLVNIGPTKILSTACVSDFKNECCKDKSTNCGTLLNTTIGTNQNNHDNGNNIDIPVSDYSSLSQHSLEFETHDPLLNTSMTAIRNFHIKSDQDDSSDGGDPQIDRNKLKLKLKTGKATSSKHSFITDTKLSSMGCAEKMHCKFIRKVQLNDDDSPNDYILINGPILLPKSLVNNKMRSMCIDESTLLTASQSSGDFDNIHSNMVNKLTAVQMNRTNCPYNNPLNTENLNAIPEQVHDGTAQSKRNCGNQCFCASTLATLGTSVEETPMEKSKALAYTPEQQVPLSNVKDDNQLSSMSSSSSSSSISTAAPASNDETDQRNKALWNFTKKSDISLLSSSLNSQSETDDHPKSSTEALLLTNTNLNKDDAMNVANDGFATSTEPDENPAMEEFLYTNENASADRPHDDYNDSGDMSIITGDIGLEQNNNHSLKWDELTKVYFNKEGIIKNLQGEYAKRWSDASELSANKHLKQAKGKPVIEQQ